MERQELQKAYNQYIEELALNALARKPVNQNLVDMITKVQSDMRDMDIVETMKRIRESTTSKDEIYLNPEPIPKDELYLNPKPIPKDELYLNPKPIPKDELYLNPKLIPEDEIYLNPKPIPKYLNPEDIPVNNIDLSGLPEDFNTIKKI